MEQQRHEALLLDEGGADGSETLNGDSYEQSRVLRCVLAESQRSRDGVGLSSESGATHATSEDWAAQKHSASLPLRGPSSRHLCATNHGGLGLSSLTLTGLSLASLQPSNCSKRCGERPEAAAIVVAGNISLASGFVMSDATTMVMVPLLGRGVMSLVNCPKRYVTPQLSSFYGKAGVIFLFVSLKDYVAGRFSWVSDCQAIRVYEFTYTAMPFIEPWRGYGDRDLAPSSHDTMLVN